MPLPAPTNSSFSSIHPRVQLGIDSTSLGEFKICPRRYQYSIIEARVPRAESIHLTFGLLVHRGVEHYYHHRTSGLDHEESLRRVVHDLLCQTWHSGHPWQSDDKNKNRFTLLRSIVWYLDQYGSEDPIHTLTLASGKPAVELSFCFDSQYESAETGEPFLLCGHFDRIGTFADATWITDCKTTKYTINSDWFDKFTPDNQFSLYSLAGKIVFGIKTAGIIVDGWQIAINFTAFKRQHISRSEFQTNEWYRDLNYWLAQMEQCARADYWPQNDKSCNLFGGCPYRPVCSKRSEESRQDLLSKQYSLRVWDPLQRRGDI